MKFIAKLTAKQREQLHRPRPILFLIVMGVFGLPWLLLLRSGVQARQQQAEMDLKAETFFAQLPSYSRNASAQQFDLLAADLGFIPNDSRGLVIRVNKNAEQAFRSIDAPLGEFLWAQATKTSGPLEAPPSELTAYLEAYAVPIAVLQTHLLVKDLPQWDLIFEPMFESSYPFPGFFNARNLQRVLLLSALAHHQQGQQSEMLQALEASWRLNQALLARPDLVSQISSSAVSELQAGLLRHLTDIPDVWQLRLSQQAERQSVLKGRQFDTWLQYKIKQQSLNAAVYRSAEGATPKQRLSSTLSYWFSPAYVFQLKSINTTQTAQMALVRLDDLDVCSATQRTAEQMLASEKTARWNSVAALSPDVLARRWKVSGDRMLSLELTEEVLRLKQHFKENGNWPAELPNTDSRTCQGEHWIYSLSDEGLVTLSFSAEPLTTLYSPELNPGPPMPFRYEFSLDY